MNPLIEQVGRIDSIWSLSAFAIAAALVLARLVLASPAGRKAGPLLLQSALVWPIVAVICVLGALPILSSAYVESQRLPMVYRMRVTVLDQRGRPVSGARIRSTVSNETAVTAEDAAILTIPKALVPADGRATIFADLDSAFLHGSTDVQLATDLNPTVTVMVGAALDATIKGVVVDERGRSVAGATVTVVGGESGESSAQGTFELKAGAAEGQTVRVRAEKSGYEPVDQDAPAGRAPLTLVLETAVPARSAK